MSFNIFDFARVNKVFLIWTAFAALIYLLRDLFGLVFITFVLSFVIHSVSRFFTHVLKVKRRRVVVCGIYLFLLGAIAAFLIMGFPKILAEAKEFTLQLPLSIDKVEQNIDSFIANNPAFGPFLERVREGITLDSLVSRGWTWGRSVIGQGWHYVSWFFIAIIFSFLIVFDLPSLIQKFRTLRYTRAHSIYDETVSSVIQFAKVVGENFKAQIYISAINTAFTFAGLTAIGTGMTALLSVVVFACGLIPVMGVFISSVPVMLVAINTGGLHMLVYALLLIVVIHAIEAYILNPRIVSSVLHINPVITLMILYIAHSIMGIWGMFLGVPISVYIYAQLTAVKNGPHPSAQHPEAGSGPFAESAGPPGQPEGSLGAPAAPSGVSAGPGPEGSVAPAAATPPASSGAA
ncbi:MAG: AI-2E family transporter [Deltaproteobacteria bacterium]|jgi:predicted PurR-regulated permease PerM|nr:AI-2E family transporter [Deltaproteobacteria bacterium]